MSALRRLPVAAPVLLALSPLAAGIAQAQEQLEEIIVTARLRSETSIEAPAAIKAFTAAEIDSAGIQTPHDFIALTPNMTVVQTQNPGNSFITIRGVSQARNSDMPVAVVVDGVLMTNPAQFNQELFDIEQIEVLEGPAGRALRAQRHRRRRLDRDESADATSSRRDCASAPIRARVRWRRARSAGRSVIATRGSTALRCRYSDTDGFRENEFLDDKADPYQDTSARVRFTWEPNDNLTGDFRYARSDIETTALHFVINDDCGRSAASSACRTRPISRLDVAPADVNNVNYTGVPIRVNNPGEGIEGHGRGVHEVGRCDGRAARSRRSRRTTTCTSS